MGNLFLGFPVARAKIADMISTSAPPLAHKTQHQDGGTDEIDVTGLVGAGGGGLPLGDFTVMSSLIEALTGFNTIATGNASVTLTPLSAVLATGTPANNKATIYKEIENADLYYTFGKNLHFRTVLILQSLTSVTSDFYIGVGSPVISPHVGVKIVNGVLSGTVGNGAQETTVFLQTIATTGFNATRGISILFTSGISCKFYVNGTLLGTITTNLQDSFDFASRLIHGEVSNPGVAESKTMKVQPFSLIFTN